MTGYVYQGKIRDLMIDLETANAVIMAERNSGSTRMLDSHPEFEWPHTRRKRLAEDSGCGTDAGYKRHKKRHEGACEACRIAHNAAGRARKARR